MLKLQFFGIERKFFVRYYELQYNSFRDEHEKCLFYLLPDPLLVCSDLLLACCFVSFDERVTWCLEVDSVRTEGEAVLLRLVFVGLVFCVDEELTFSPDLLPEPDFAGLLRCS